MAADFGTVRADPVVLTATAEEAMRSISEYKAGLEQITKYITSSTEFWKGEAGDAFRQVFNVELQKAQLILDSYEQYPKDLLGYAGLYQEVIRLTEETASSISEFSME